MSKCWFGYAKFFFAYAVILIADGVIVEILACCGWPLDWPFYYLAAGMIAFVAGMPCYLKMANSLPLEKRRVLGWQFWMVFSRASRFTRLLYIGSILHMIFVIYLTMSSKNSMGGELQTVAFPTGMMLFMASASLMSCSAFLRSMTI
jgi:hypothetical protein